MKQTKDKIEVLLVEDEPMLAMIIKETLEQEGFHIRIAADGEEGLAQYRVCCPDLIVTDIMMPRIDGFTLVKRIRQEGSSIPVLFLSARSAANDVVEGFEIGGNDYLKKPFGMAELMVRIKALLHRIEPHSSAEQGVTLGQYRFDALTETLSYGGEVTPLSHRESELLKRLCDQLGEVVPMKELLLDLWGDDSFFNARSLHVFITKLRRKLEKDASIRILNARGVGYKLIVVR